MVDTGFKKIALWRTPMKSIEELFPFLRVVLSRRLPRSDAPREIPDDLCSYGRFGYSKDGDFVVSGGRTLHPVAMRNGGYFGLGRDYRTLFLSPVEGLDSSVSDSTIRRISAELGLKDIYRYFKVQERTENVPGLMARRRTDGVGFAPGR